MDRPNDELVAQLRKTARCRAEVRQLAEVWSGLSAPRYEALAAVLSEQGEAGPLGILLNVAAANQVRMNPRVLAVALRTVDVLTDIAFACRYQDQAAIGPLLEVALAEDLSWERQALAAQLATELTVKFDQPKQPVKKVLWRLDKEILAPQARALIHLSLGILEDAEPLRGRHLWLTEQDLFRALPKERPPVVTGGDYTVRRPVAKLGRNEPCHCGSGKKYKKCCYDKDQELLRDASGYEGLTRSQLAAVPSLVADTAPIETMRLLDLKKLVPATLNDDQLLAAYYRVEMADLRELAFAMLLELKQRPGKESLALEHMKDLFDSALRGRDRVLAEKLARHIPEAELYDTEASRLHHALLEHPETYADLEALCKKAMRERDNGWDHPLLELSYAFDTIMPALSVVFGRAAIVSEPQRVFDNEVLFDSIEKNRIALDLEPWGDPIEEYLDWASEKVTAQPPDKERKIEELKEQLVAAQEKSAQTQKDLRKKALELVTLETRLKEAGPAAPKPQAKTLPAPAQSPPSAAPSEAENRGQVHALKRKIETLKEEIRSQQASRQAMRSQLREANQRLSNQDDPSRTPAAFPPAEEDIGLAGESPKRILFPEFSDAFRKSCEKLPQAVAAKALQAAAGFAARDESVLRQAAPLEQLPGYVRVRVGIHHRLLLRQGAKSCLEVVDLIPRQNLETWIRQHVV